MPPLGVRLCDVDVSRQGASHTCKCQYCACLPCPFLFRTLLLRGTVVGPRLAPLCLSAVCSPISHQACFHSRVCLPSQLCVQRCPAARARTPVWHLPAELGVVAGGARRPACWQAWQAPYLCSNCRLLSELLLQTLFLSPNAGQTMRPRSLPVLVPGNRLEPTQATHFLPTRFVSHILEPIFGCPCDLLVGSDPVSCVYLTSFVPKHVMAHGHVESQSVKRKRTVQDEERLLVQDKDSGVRANRRCSTLILSWNAAARLARVWLLRLLRKVPFFRLMRLIE